MKVFSVLLLCVLFGLTLFATSWAQPSAQRANPPQTGTQPASVVTLRELVAGGYYALAAQVDGPQVVKANPDNAEARLLYAQALYLVGNLEAAATQLGRAKPLATTPELKRVAAHLGALLRAAQGNPESAVRALAQLFASVPDYEVAMDWGQVAWQGGNLEAALQAYRAAATTTQGQNEPWPSLNVARLLLLQNKFAEAITTLETTLTVLEASPSARPSPAYAEAFFRLGEAHEALGEPDEAVSNFQAALSVSPDYLPAQAALERLEKR